MMNQLYGTTPLFGGNAPFVEELYENYLDNPASVPGEWRDYFDKLAQLPGTIARDVPLGSIYKGTMPFIAVDVLRLLILCAFPAISLWLPGFVE